MEREAEAQNHAAPLLEALACRERARVSAERGPRPRIKDQSQAGPGQGRLSDCVPWSPQCRLQAECMPISQSVPEA